MIIESATNNHTTAGAAVTATATTATSLRVAIPTHCSSVDKIVQRTKQQCFHATESSSSSLSSSSPPSGSSSSSSSSSILFLQCNLDGIVWNEFYPMMLQAKKAAAGPARNSRTGRSTTIDYYCPFDRAMWTLIRHFKNDIIYPRYEKENRQPTTSSFSFTENKDENNAMCSDNGVNVKQEGVNNGFEISSASPLFYEQQAVTRFSNSATKKKKITKETRRLISKTRRHSNLLPASSSSPHHHHQHQHHVLLVILPPSIIAPFSSLGPERAFSSYLVSLENSRIRLFSLSALVSTLGGGCFVCRYFVEAVRLAQWQRSIALSLGDAILADQCTLHEAYSYIHAGQIQHALGIIQKVQTRRCAETQGANNDGGSATILRLCQIARSFAKRMRRLQRRRNIITALTDTNNVNESVSVKKNVEI